jgi:hypothetical protein
VHDFPLTAAVVIMARAIDDIASVAAPGMLALGIAAAVRRPLEWNIGAAGQSKTGNDKGQTYFRHSTFRLLLLVSRLGGEHAAKPEFTSTLRR